MAIHVPSRHATKEFLYPGRKPMGPIQIARNTFAEGLKCLSYLREGAGDVVFDLVDRVQGTHGGTWQPGVGNLSDHSGNYITFPNSYFKDMFDGAKHASMAMRATYHSFDGDQDYNTLHGANVHTGNATILWCKSDGNMQFGGRSQQSDGFQTISAGAGTISTGVTYDFVGVWDYENKRCILYIDGVEEVNSSVTWGSTTFAPGTPNKQFGIGGQNINSRRSDATIEWFGFWERRLNLADAQALHKDPHILIEPATPPLRFVTAGAPAPEFPYHQVNQHRKSMQTLLTM